MAVFCIPRYFVSKLQDAARRGEINIQKLYEMTSAERRDVFARYTDAELGQFINAKFEEAMVLRQKNALLKWAQRTFTPDQQKSTMYKSIVDKINQLDDLGVLSPKNEKLFLEDLVSDKLGVTVTPEEIRVISNKAKVVQEAQTKLGNEFGNPKYEKELTDFLTAKKNLDEYLLGLNPSSNTRILTGTYGRGMLLASAKTPLLNVLSNTALAIPEYIVRRIRSLNVIGADNQLAKNYQLMARRIYKKTGYDISRMMTLSDTGVRGMRVLGDTVHTQGEGTFRKAAHIVEDIVFKNLLGAPDAAYAAWHFSDSLNIASMRLAKNNRVLARQWMEDAMRLEPATAEGAMLRQQAILDAQTATWTNKTWASNISEGIRNILNRVTGDLRLGDIRLPFVKTPANVVATGIDYSGLGIAKAITKTARVMREKNVTTTQITEITTDLARSGLGLTGAWIITNFLDNDDFVGAYDPKRAQIEQLRNSNYNAIRIGDRWVSLEYLGPFGITIAAIMYARQMRDKGFAERMFSYGKGVATSVMTIPGINDIYDEVRTYAFKQNIHLEDMTGNARDYFIALAASRLIPSVVSDIAKTVDPYKRQAKTGIEATQAKIPYVRESLPIKRDILGQPIRNENPVITMLFGERIKRDQQTPITKELYRVIEATGKNINFTNWNKSSSKKLQAFKKFVGEKKYQEAEIRYGKRLGYELRIMIHSPQYRNASDEKKLSMLNKLDNKVIETVFRDYRFSYHTRRLQ